jgi:D-serine deaminase-like pyridoxal phosphate-dependent protein
LTDLQAQVSPIAKATSGEFEISVLVDNVDSLAFKSESLFPGKAPLSFFIKIDCNYNRAGVIVESKAFKDLLDLLRSQDRLAAAFLGLYTHWGGSYSGDSATDAISGLQMEIKTLKQAADRFKEAAPNVKSMVLSIGATPTATSIQNMRDPGTAGKISEFKNEVDKLRTQGLIVELHAGVYPVLDLQQVATHARAKEAGLSHQNIALTIQAEVVGRYYRNGRHEALIAAGTLALGREPCKSYSGWGVVAPQVHETSFYSDETPEGWIVGRISQEHGILTWEHPAAQEPPQDRDLRIGDVVRIWPNHACIAGAMHDRYLVVDSSSSEPAKVVEMWNRCRGWKAPVHEV